MNFQHIFSFLQPGLWTLLMQIWYFGSQYSPARRVKNGMADQKMWFFKVCDIITTIQPEEKTHLTMVNSTLKSFWDHSLCHYDNLKKLYFWTYHDPCSRSISHIVPSRGNKLFQSVIFSNYSRNKVSSPKMILGKN